MWLDILNIGSLISGIFVIITKNPVVAVLYLIALFLHISAYLLLIGISFIGLSYLLVYIGAVSILFIFILMLINVRVSELHSDSSNGLFLSFVVGIAFYSSVISILPAHQSLIIKLYRALDPFKYDQIEKPYHGNVSTGDKWDGNLSCATDISSIGNIIYTSHALWLMLVSLILLLAMVGAIVMTVNPVSPVKSVNFNKINNLFNSK